MAKAKKEKKRREKGTGSIEWLAPDKCRLIVSVIEEGKRKKYYRTFKTTSKVEANKALREFTTEVEAGNFVKPSERKTFSDLVKDWLELSAEDRLAPKTLYEYKLKLNKWVLPKMGTLRYTEIKAIDLDRFYKELKQSKKKNGDPLSNQTILNIHKIIHSIFEFALKKDLIQKNPASLTEKITVERKSRFYDSEQIEQLLQALKKENIKYQTLVHLTLATGCRLGETMGLEWKHINFEKGTMEIIQAGQYLPKGSGDKDGVFTKSPKNKSSIRKIEISKSVLPLLKFYKKHQEWKAEGLGNMWKNSDRLFTNRNGGPQNPSIISGWFSRFITRHNLPSLSLHGLRHSAASYLLNQGEPIQNVSKLLGHSSPAITLSVYTHAAQNATKGAALKMEDLFQQAAK